MLVYIPENNNNKAIIVYLAVRFVDLLDPFSEFIKKKKPQILETGPSDSEQLVAIVL